MVDRLARSPKACRRKHALESERSSGKTQAVPRGVRSGRKHDVGSVPSLWNFTADGSRGAAPLSAGGGSSAGSGQPCTASTSQPDATGDRRASAGLTAGPHALGAKKAEGGAGARVGGTELAGGEHDGNDVRARGVGGGAEATAEDAPLHPAVRVGACAQPGVVRGLQGLVPHRRWRAHRSVDCAMRIAPRPKAAVEMLEISKTRTFPPSHRPAATIMDRAAQPEPGSKLSTMSPV